MAKWSLCAMAMAFFWASPGGAGDLGAPIPARAAEPTPLEWVRHVRPRIGRSVAVPSNGVLVPTIEWRRPVEVRVRTESGEPLTDLERRAVRDLALVCDRGEVRDVADLLERNGTYVVEYDCAWLQGFEGRRGP